MERESAIDSELSRGLAASIGAVIIGNVTFVTDGDDQAWKQAQLAAGDKDVLVPGGPETASQFLRTGLVDEIRLQLVPVLLGQGSRLFDDADLAELNLERIAVEESPEVTHLRFGVSRRP